MCHCSYPTCGCLIFMPRPHFTLFFFNELNVLCLCTSPLIRNAWNNRKSTARNLQEMGLAFDPNRSLPIKKTSVSV